MRLGCLIYHGLDQRSINCLLLIDCIEQFCILVTCLYDQFGLHFFLLPFLVLTHLLLQFFKLLLFIISPKGTLQHLLAFKAALLDLLQLTGILLHVRLPPATAEGTSPCTATIATIIIIPIGIDVLPGFRKAAFQVLLFLLPFHTLGILGINVVEFTLRIAGHRTVGSFLVVAQGTDGCIGTILREMLVHFFHLIANTLVPGIRQ